MSKAEEIAILGDGYCLFRQKNSAGGYTYLSDEDGAGMVVWDTALTGVETLLTAIAYHMKQEKIEWAEKQKALRRMVEDNETMGLYDE